MPDNADAAFHVVAGSKAWNRRVFDDVIRTLGGEWAYVESPDELAATIAARRPRRVFFLHWSWKVPPETVAALECVNFHMTDVPYGRGGSPLQNLIARGHQETMLSALRMTDEMDAGPVYLKRELGLHGTAEEVYVRSSVLAAEMIGWILDHDPQPVEQQGEVVAFARRRPADSEVPESPSLADLHDFIRMLDAEGYPHAFLRSHGLRFELRRSALYDGRIEADVRITADPGP